MKYAIVKLGDYNIPLIGIKPSATMEKCDICNNIFYILDINLVFKGYFLCCKCERRWKHRNKV